MINLNNPQLSINRLEIIQAIKAGQEKHIREYAEALADYQAVLLKEFTRIQGQISAGNFKDVSVNIPAPQDHSGDYSHILNMLERGTAEDLVVDSNAFKAYFNNEWVWSRGFAETASFYKASLGASN